MKYLVIVLSLLVIACDKDGNMQSAVDRAEEEDREEAEREDEAEEEKEEEEAPEPDPCDRTPPLCPDGSRATKCVGGAWGCGPNVLP